MKILTATWALSLLFTASTFALPGSGSVTLSENGTTSATLQHCDGSVKLTASYSTGQRRTVLQIRDVMNCSWVSLDGVPQDRLNRYGNGGGSTDLVISDSPGYDMHVVTLRSNSGKTQDTIRVITYSQPPPPQEPSANIVFTFNGWSTVFGGEKYAELRDCRGNVTARLSNGDTLTLVFRDLQNCSKFDILAASGGSVNYPQKSLQRNSRGGFSGSFTIPKRYVDEGRNQIKVIVRSISGQHDEVILIRFTAY